jgi:alcohol dehydrogenase, propanol-preferring
MCRTAIITRFLIAFERARSYNSGIMRAMRLHEIGKIDGRRSPLSLEEVSLPEPAAGEVRIQVNVCAVCHTELDQIEGRVATPLPRILGHQVVGQVDALGEGTNASLLGNRVGVGWIGGACGQCRWCERGEENLCPYFKGTGRDLDGGYAEFMTVDAEFIHPIPGSLSDKHAAPFLCAGAIGLRSLRLSGLNNGQVLGLTGFGASNHLVLTLARAILPESPVMVWARNPDQRKQAMAAGAVWAGDTFDDPPDQPDAIIDTTPVWAPVMEALRRLAPGGRLVINAISKESVDQDRLAELDYPAQLWKEKEIKSVANVARRDISEFLETAASHGFTPEIQTFTLEQANQALFEVRSGNIRGAKVLVI